MSSPERDGGFIRKAAFVATGGLAFIGALTAYDRAGDLLPGLPELPDLNFDLGNNPPAAEAAVLPETYKTESTFDIACQAQVGVGVGIHGNKDELIGGGEYDKLLFGDFLLCGEQAGRLAALATIERDTQTDEIRSVRVETDGLTVTHPRIDHTDPRNCAPTRTDNSMEENWEEIAEWRQAQENGEKPECDDGFNVSGLGGGSDLAKIKETAFAAAQIAMALDAQPQAIIDGLNESFVSRLEEELQSRYPGATIQVVLRTTPEQMTERFERVTDELRSNFYDVELDDDDGKPVLNISAPGGGEVTVRIRSIRSSDIDIDRITEVIEEPETERGTE